MFRAKYPNIKTIAMGQAHFILGADYPNIKTITMGQAHDTN